MKGDNMAYNPSTTLPHLKSAALRYRDLSMNQIRRKLKRSKKNGRSYSLHQRILIIKLLQLSGMAYTSISKEIGIARNTLYSWQDELADAVFTSEPEAKIAEALETDLATSQTKLLKKVYRNMEDALDKQNEIIKTANSIRHLHVLNENLTSTLEVLKAEKKGQEPLEKPNNFFTQVFNQMIDNSDNGNQD